MASLSWQLWNCSFWNPTCSLPSPALQISDPSHFVSRTAAWENILRHLQFKSCDFGSLKKHSQIEGKHFSKKTSLAIEPVGNSRPWWKGNSGKTHIINFQASFGSRILEKNHKHQMRIDIKPILHRLPVILKLCLQLLPLDDGSKVCVYQTNMKLKYFSGHL